ncbi:MAG TPA: winged helix-turn-helix domain-containing protein [Hyphomicrobiaceae bacterium]
MGALRFDGFTLDRSGPLLSLRRGGKDVALRPQALKVLAYLAGRPGRAVSNNELIENCWEEGKRKLTYVNSVAQCIKEIRDALGKTKKPIIRTLPRQGYVFVAPVSEAAATLPDPPNALAPAAPEEKLAAQPLVSIWPWRTPAFLRDRLPLAAGLTVAIAAAVWLVWSWAARPTELTMMAVPSLVVLPFTNSGSAWGGSGGQEALAQEIATQLLRVPRGFKIIVKSPPAYKDKRPDPKTIGRELGVRYVVLGAMRRDGDAVRVDVQFIETDTDRQLWAEPFEYAPGEAGAQNRMAMRIARLVTERITAVESKRSLPAHPKAEHYAIMGRALWAGERDAKITLEAMALFKKGLDLDPNSVPALQGYARAKISAVLAGWVPEDQGPLWLNDAEQAINRVVAQRRTSYGAYRLRGSLLRARGEWEPAVKALQHALVLNSDYAEARAELGRVKIELGLAEEALDDIRKAIALSPTDSASLAGWRLWAGEAAVHIGDYVAAVDWLEGARQANQADFSPLPWLAVAYAGIGQEDKARAEMSTYLAKAPGFTLAAWNRDNPRSHHPVVAEQRARIAEMLRRLGVPEGDTRTSAARVEDQ